MNFEEYETRRHAAEALFMIAKNRAYESLNDRDIDQAHKHIVLAQGYLDRLKELEIEYGKTR